MKWIIPLSIILLFSVPSGTGQQSMEVKISFDPNSFNSTTFLISENVDGLELTIGNTSASYQNGIVEFETNVFGIGDTMTVSFNGKEVSMWTIPASQYIHVTHVYSRWAGGQPPPIENVGLGQGAVLTLNRLIELETLPDTRFGELVVNTLLSSEDDLNKDGTVEEAIDPFGLLQFIFGMRDHLGFAGTTSDVDPIFAQNVTAVLPMFNTLIEGQTVAGFIPLLNTSETLFAKIYQVAFELATNSGSQTFQDLKNLIDETFEQTLSIFNQPRDHTFGGTVVITLANQASPSTESEKEQMPLSWIFITILLGLAFKRVRISLKR